jgi:predicted MFS family arabinose efflux permease
LLAGAYFLGFALMQLPLGRALDRWGPRRVLLLFLGLAMLACAAFALARSFMSLLAARALIGIGVSACLMAPLTAYRLRFDPTAQLRANSWMLMTGSLGMLASTLPVQWLLPSVGWRGLFWLVAGLLVLAALLIAWVVPRDALDFRAAPSAQLDYRAILGHPYFVRLSPLAFFVYGGLIAVQSLWAGPWLTDVAGNSAAGAARGLFAINLSMLFAFLGWGFAMPRLARRGWQVDRLITLGMPLSLLLLVGAVAIGPRAGAAWWAVWCVSCTVVSLSQPALAQAFPTTAAGRALSAFNLVIFLGVFCVQWGIGLAIDMLRAFGWSRVVAFQAAFGVLALACTLSYAWFIGHGRGPAQQSA